MFDKNLDLIWIDYDTKDWNHIVDYCSEIKMSMSYTKISTELEFKLPYSVYSPEIVPLNIKKGDRIQLKYKDDVLFTGKAIIVDTYGKNQYITVKAYDYCWWFCKSKITKNFSKITVFDAVKWVYKNIGMTLTTQDEEKLKKELGENYNLMIDTHLIENVEANKVLSAIYSDVRKKTGVYYYMHTSTDGEKVIITESDRYYTGLSLTLCSSLKKADGNILDWHKEDSMENMITRYRVYKENASPVDLNQDGMTESDNKSNDNNKENSDKTKEDNLSEQLSEGRNTVILNQENINRYGVIQETITMSDDDTIAGIVEKCKNEMKKHNGEEKLYVKCFGDLDYKPAYGVLVKIPSTIFYDMFMYITTSEWTWLKDGSFISEMELSQSKHTDMTTWDDIETKQEEESQSDNTGTGSLADQIVEYAKTYIGCPYVWGGTGEPLTESTVNSFIGSSHDITVKDGANGNWKNWLNKEGYDCSGFTQSVYQHFGIEITRTTTSNQMGQGVAVDTGDVSQWKKGDLIFPSSGHVQMYIGNNQCIEAPESGRTICISSLRNSYYSVRRVLKEEDFIAKNSGKNLTIESSGISSQYIELLKELEGFVSHWDNSSKYGAIGYGTDASSTVGKRLKAQGVTSCTEAEATEWLKEEVAEWANEVTKKMTAKGASLNQYAFDCMTDIAYQWGNQKWSILDLLCNGDYEEAKSKIMKFGYPRRDRARCNILDGSYTVTE
ncbi:NlpC/P60 family protein [uncultured Clostridium sp.]|uniref:XkdQ/YqbQ family protein n=1 Tax=uncultured Clostridium sp. TaxID=59620 RepID=UPI0025EAC2F6|nr:NlpC/P60 family protein [uncultured Clostridium sp.]